MTSLTEENEQLRQVVRGKPFFVAVVKNKTERIVWSSSFSVWASRYLSPSWKRFGPLSFPVLLQFTEVSALCRSHHSISIRTLNRPLQPLYSSMFQPFWCRLTAVFWVIGFWVQMVWRLPYVPSLLAHCRCSSILVEPAAEAYIMALDCPDMFVSPLLAFRPTDGKPGPKGRRRDCPT